MVFFPLCFNLVDSPSETLVEEGQHPAASISCTATTIAGQGRVVARIEAMDVVRRDVETLTNPGVVSFMYMQSEEGPELLGEEELNSKMF